MLNPRKDILCVLESRVGREVPYVFFVFLMMAKMTLFLFSVELSFFSVNTVCWVSAHYVEF